MMYLLVLAAPPAFRTGDCILSRPARGERTFVLSLPFFSSSLRLSLFFPQCFVFSWVARRLRAKRLQQPDMPATSIRASASMSGEVKG